MVYLHIMFSMFNNDLLEVTVTSAKLNSLSKYSNVTLNPYLNVSRHHTRILVHKLQWPLSLFPSSCKGLHHIGYIA